MSSGRALLEPLNAEHDLRRNGMDGASLLKLAYQAANTYARKHPSFPASRIEDLAQHCVLQVCRRVHRYDSERNTFNPDMNPNSTPFRSWCWMQMEVACQDFVRQRKEGFLGRIGRDKEITVQLTDTLEDRVDPAAADEFEIAMNEKRLELWARAAAKTGWTVPEWLVITADHAARDLLEAA